MKTTVLVVLLIVCCGMAMAVPNHMLMIRDQKLGSVAEEKTLAGKFYEQTLDHFTFSDTRTWQQQYFVNETWWQRELSGPIFVQIGGEGAIGQSQVTSLAMSNYARRHGALQLALEHRFYGKSNPLPTLATDNLKYLTEAQALEDLAQFILWAREEFRVHRDTRVVVFGCSYPGSLSAWFRIKYPHIAIGAVSNSSPVLAVLDFFQYLEVVDRSLSYYSGKQCDDRIEEATNSLSQLLKSNPQQVQQMFDTCTTPIATKDVQTFWSYIVGNFQGVVQYNNEHHNPVNIDLLCSIMENTTMTPLESLVQVNKLFLDGSCMDISYNNSVAFVQNGQPPNAARSWFWQTCQAFGYYQTTDAPRSAQPFPRGALPLKYYTEMCTDTFGIPFEDPTPAINRRYGGKDVGSSTNIFFVDGTIDPWESLTVTENLSPTINAYMIEGTAHCAQLFPPSDENNPPPGLMIAQQLTDAQIQRWLQE